MQLLLTSGGVRNASMREELTRMLGKPIAEATALCIPTAAFGHPAVQPEGVWRFISGNSEASMTNLGWKSVGVLELTALPDIPAARWQKWLQQADVLLVDGGDAVYLNYWLQKSGVAAFLPQLPNLVWVGVSAGSMVMAPRIGQFFCNWVAPTGTGDRTMGVVDFGIFPHLHLFDENNMDNAQKWVHAIGIPGYVLDEQSAIAVTNGVPRVVSEGEWHLLQP